jgi:hypothetical protein
LLLQICRIIQQEIVIDAFNSIFKKTGRFFFALFAGEMIGSGSIRQMRAILASGTVTLAMGFEGALGSGVGWAAKFGNSWICSLELEVPLLFTIVGGSGAAMMVESMLGFAGSG